MDIIRAVAMLMIIFFHYNCATIRIVSNEVTLSSFYGYGRYGVSLFLVLSGAALTLSTRENFTLKTFFKKRFLAIFPLFWTVYILFVLGGTIFLPCQFLSNRPPASFIFTILGIDGLLSLIGPNYYLIGEWFLGCILILYLLYPAIRYLFYSNKHVLLLTSFAVSFFLEKIYCLKLPLFCFPLFRISEFVFGMYFITIIKEHDRRQNLLLFTFAVSGILSILLFYHGGALFITDIAFGILLFVALGCLSNIYLPKGPGFRTAVGFLCKYSYAAFLLHHLLLIQIVNKLHDYLWIPHVNWAVFFVTVVLIYVCAYVVQNSLRWILRTPIAAL